MTLRWQESLRLAGGDESLAEDIAYIFDLASAEAHADGTVTLRTPGGRECRMPRARALLIIAARWGASSA